MSVADFQSNTARPLRLRMRPDITAERRRYQARDCWILKDPLRLQYFRFEEEEYALLRMLDGETSLDDMRRRFETDFAPQRIKVSEIHRFLGSAHRSGLILSDGAGQGSRLFERGREREARRRASLLLNPLTIRFRGIDPDRLLTSLDHRLGWMFSRSALVLCLVISTAAILLLTTHAEEFMRRLPAAQSFFGPRNWLVLATVLGLTKICHEFGHGLACKRFGGECHEMGVMVLCFTPCLYCDVTDSWMIPDRWRRAAVAAAGMYVEFWIASLATFVWWFSEPGWANQIALNVMFVCSVSTIVFNANPLLRYDGYYILSDLLEVPNLRAKATGLLRQVTLERWWGSRAARDRFLPTRYRGLLVAYAVASLAYQWFITAAILGFLYSLTEPLGFKIGGQLLAVASLLLLVAVPLRRLIAQLQELGSRDNMSFAQQSRRFAAIVALPAALLFLPLPYYVRCPARFQPQHAAGVYVDVPGAIVQTFVRPGDTVRAGDPLVRLENPDLELALARLTTQRETQLGKLAALQRRAPADADALADLAQAEETLAAIDEELSRRKLDLTKLVVLAPCDGEVFTPPLRPRQDDSQGRLSAWHGHPLEQRNLGARLAPSDMICLIGPRETWEAVLAVEGTEVEFVREGRRVDLLPAQRPGERIRTAIESVSQQEMKAAPREMSEHGGGELLTQADSFGGEKPRFTTYQASAPFATAGASTALNGGGTARVHAPYQSLAARGWRALRRTFHFEM